ncbi:Uncharacterized protein APZ42_006674 [Daphnia magna]|uniref:Uncharacterized protein n=1 Tax=Daphnia magna TaxID=35525 RepID=A0A164FRL1_9CRUS|nr:Uncharacterized protein APZ42_006674 [Daphnia magna]
MAILFFLYKKWGNLLLRKCFPPDKSFSCRCVDVHSTQTHL